jgi:SAM-dependent methyltransferase
MIMKKVHRHIATEQQSFDEILEGLASKKKWAETVLARLRSVSLIPGGARILDVGAANGGFLIACSQLSYQGEGIEPWEEARRNAIKLAEYLGIPIHILDGTAESIPYDSGTFDVVHAASVIEHVFDVDQAFEEICRVLKPGGVFWFETASAMCPVQKEIRGFPFFGWYPDAMRRRLMNWAKEAKPHLIGHTNTPAFHWFTPSKARTLLQRHGFKQVYDRWDLRQENEGGRAYQWALRVVRSSKLSKTLADIIVPDCAYAAIK